MWLWLLVVAVACGTPPAGNASPSPAPDGLVKLPGWDAGVPGLEVPVPDGYKARTEKGHDFDIHFLEPPSGSGALGSVYVGHNPGLLHKQLESVGKVAMHRETIGRESVPVYDFSINSGKRTVREAMLTGTYGSEAGSKAAELKVHISVTGATVRDVDVLWKYMTRVRRQSP
jgi:hypothetical protein